MKFFGSYLIQNRSQNVLIENLNVLPYLNTKVLWKEKYYPICYIIEKKIIHEIVLVFLIDLKTHSTQKIS